MTVPPSTDDPATRRLERRSSLRDCPAPTDRATVALEELQTSLRRCRPPTGRRVASIPVRRIGMLGRPILRRGLAPTAGPRTTRGEGDHDACAGPSGTTEDSSS